MPPPRRKIPQIIQRQVLHEAGYQCANPACRTFLTLQFHHLDHVEHGGSNNADNLIALCPSCHARYHQDFLPEETIRTWKMVLTTLNEAATKEAVALLLFLHSPPNEPLRIDGYRVSSDGVVRFAELIVAGLAQATLTRASSGGYTAPWESYLVSLTDKGRRLVDAWKEGRMEDVTAALSESASSTLAKSGSS